MGTEERLGQRELGTGRTGLRMGKEEDSVGFSLVNCQMLGPLLKWRIRRKMLSPLGTQRVGWAEGAYRRPVVAEDQTQEIDSERGNV